VCHSGGYSTTHSAVRNGRVFDLRLANIAKENPTVNTYNSCASCSCFLCSSRTGYSAELTAIADENCTRNDRVTLGRDYMKAYN
jgi:hypothetical protein